MLIFLVYNIREPEASAKICVYVFILMRVFIQIYFWILFTRSEELWLFPLHTSEDLKKKKKFKHGTRIYLLSHRNLFRNQERENLKINKTGGLHPTAAACYLPCGGFSCDLSSPSTTHGLKVTVLLCHLSLKCDIIHRTAVNTLYIQYMLCIYWPGRNLNIYINRYIQILYWKYKWRWTL